MSKDHRIRTPFQGELLVAKTQAWKAWAMVSDRFAVGAASLLSMFGGLDVLIDVQPAMSSSLRLSRKFLRARGLFQMSAKLETHGRE